MAEQYKTAQPGIGDESESVFFFISISNYNINETYSVHVQWSEGGTLHTALSTWKFTVIPAYPRNEFDLEYDHQTSSDYTSLILDVLVVSNCLTKMKNAFDDGANGAKTKIKIIRDEALDSETENNPLLINVIPENQVFQYQFDHYTLTEDLTDFLHEGHIVVVMDLAENIQLPPPEVRTTGMSNGGNPGRGGWTVIFWDGANDDINRVKTTIHELGHQRAALSHLCDNQDETILNSQFHDENFCVMSQKVISSCTGVNVAINPRFCSICRLRP